MSEETQDRVAVAPPDNDSDSFLDSRFSRLDTRSKGSEFDEIIAGASPEELAAIEEAERKLHPPAAAPVVAQPVAVPEPVAQTGYPKEFRYPDGSSAVIRIKNGQLQATLDPGDGGGLEVFYGRSEGELLTQVLAGKLNATKKIREQNRQLKLQPRKRAAAAAPPPPPPPKVRQLTADEVFEVKTQLEADPDLALQTWFQKKTGLTVEQLVEMAQSGKNAETATFIVNESDAFIAEHPDYLTTANNFRNLVAYLSKEYLNEELPDGDLEPTLDRLLAKGAYNRETLAEAYDELKEAGLLQLEQPDAETTETVEDETTTTQVTEQPAPPVIAVPPPPPPAPPKPTTTDEAGIQRTVKKRAAPGNLGIRQQDTQSAVVTTDDGAPTVEDFENMSVDELNALLEAVGREHIRQGRR